MVFCQQALCGFDINHCPVMMNAIHPYLTPARDNCEEGAAGNNKKGIRVSISRKNRVRLWQKTAWNLLKWAPWAPIWGGEELYGSRENFDTS